MKSFFKFTALTVATLFVSQTSMVFAQDAMDAQKPKMKPAKYIILFIGDGMSLPQRMLADEYNKRLYGNGLAINQFPYMGYTKTNSANSFITDSAASGTAIACGTKTDNHFLGVDSKRNRLESVAEFAKKNGYAVGILSSITINHATPASFYAHIDNRDNYYAIGKDLVKSDFDYFGGGGVNSANGRDGNIYELAKKEGYTVAHGKDEIRKLDLKNEKKIIAYGHSGQLPYALDMDKDDVDLAEFTQQAIDFLSTKNKPFFMMVEGGMIDSHGHSNDAASSLAETRALDKAVSVAVDFYKKHEDETLIIVTGDHETGGLTLGFANTGYDSYIDLLTFQSATRDSISNKLRPVFQKMGNNVELNNEVKDFITDNFGLVFPDRRNEGLAKLREKVRNNNLKLTSRLEQLVLNPGEVRTIQESLGRRNASNTVSVLYKMFNNKCGIGWTSGAHTALPVATSSLGVNAEQFSGMFDNTDISKRLKSIIAVSAK